MATQNTPRPAPPTADERRFAALQAAFRRGRADADPAVAEMRAQRTAKARKEGSFSSSTTLGAGALTFATGRPRDPLFYWKQNNLPYELTRADELIRLRAYCRLLYASHPVIASCIDIYTKYPLLGMELRCKDQSVTDFYTELFLDEDRLNYPEFLLRLGREYWCALPGEQVSMKGGGCQDVESVVVDDEVLTHRGRMRPVISTTQRQYQGRAFKIKPRYGLPLKFTEGHKIYVSSHGNALWKKIETLSAADDMVFIPVDRSVAAKDVVSIWEVLDQDDWEVYGPYQEDPEWTPRYRKYQRERAKKLVAQGLKHGAVLRRKGANRGRWSLLEPTEYVVDAKMMELLGLYVAEGNATDDSAQWSFGPHEYDLAVHTQELIRHCFGMESRLQIRERTHCVMLYNHVLAAWFGALFGHGAKEKVLPDWIMELAPETLAPFLDGWFTGDGHAAHQDGSQNRRWIRITTASRALMSQAEMLIRRAGFVTTTYQHHSTTKNGTTCDWWTIGPVMGSTRAFASYLGWDEQKITNTFGEIRDTAPRYVVQDIDGYWVKIASIEEFDYDGPVYDLGVAEDHSFVASSVAVHNCVGEAWPFATFNEPLGIWEHEELLNPDDIEVQSSPFLRDPRFLIRLPKTLREVITRREPAWEYEQLMAAYPELAHYSSNDAKMPVSNILLRQLKFETDTFNPRGVPILMRAMRAVMQEEMLNAAQDAIADRLYTPLLLARLGASATELGTETPWVPTPDDLEEFEQALDAALAGDFRVLTYHFGVQLDEVFGRESMPDLSADFERLEGRILLAFGLSSTLLTGAGEGETYAADALNKDLVSQLLTTYQNVIKRHYRQRALIVAEAQEHYDYEERGGKRYVKYEEILEVDEESGQESIVRQPKLLIPDMHMNTMSLSDDEQQRAFLEQLREAGIPISMRTRLTNIPIDFEDEMERSIEEQVQLAVAEQETRKRQYLALRAAGLPIPADLRADFEPKAAQAQFPNPAEGLRTPVLGLDPSMPYPNLAPTPEDLQMDPTAAMPGAPVEPGADLAPEEEPEEGGEEGQRPEESDEQRGGMPKDAALYRQAARMRALANARRPVPPPAKDAKLRRALGLTEPPRHIGLRRYATGPDMPASYDGGHGQPPHTELHMTAAAANEYDDESVCDYCDSGTHDRSTHPCGDCGEQGHEAFYGMCPYSGHYTRDLPQLYHQTTGLHRGIGLDLGPEDHRLVHDQTSPPAQRATHLLDRVRTGGDFGRYWTGDHPDPDVDAVAAAERFATLGGNTHVVLHVAKPDFAHVISTPQQLKAHNVWRWTHNTPEFGLHPGTPLHVTGISWKPDGDQDWTRHDFDTPILHAPGAGGDAAAR